MKKFIVFLISVLFLFIGTAGAAVINITPDMTPEAVYQAIESAVAGDEVVIAPGTYRSRVYVTNNGTASNRITIRGLDPNNRPVFDYTMIDGIGVTSLPGTGAGWLAQYGWVVQGSYYLIQDIIIKGVRESPKNTVGLWNGPMGIVQEPAAPGTQPQSNIFRRIEITESTNGLASTGHGTLIEDSYIHHNGVLGSTAAIHNAYIHGGSITFKRTKFDMALTGQHINSRAQLLVIDDCEFGEMGSFVINVLTPKADMVQGTPFEQRTIIKNSAISGVRHNNPSLSKAIALMNGNNYIGLKQYLEMYDNVYIGSPTVDPANKIVALYRSSGTLEMGVTSIGNSYTNYGVFLGLNSGEDVNSSFYKIDVRDVSDASLPTGSGTDPVDPVEPPPPAPGDITFNMSWDQASTENLHGWLIWATTDQANWGTPQFISYAEGMSFVSQATLPIANEYFFRIRPVNILMEQGEGEDATVSLDIPLPGPTTNFTVVIAQ